jgi:AcrR family transcriptional regulator
VTSVASSPNEPSFLERKREHVRQLMREEILASAAKIIHHEGLPGLSMRALALSVGVSAPTIYDYFESKEAVLQELHLKGLERLEALFQRAGEGAEPGLPQIREMVDAYRTFAHQEPDLFRLIFGQYRDSVAKSEDLEARSKHLFEVLVASVCLAIDRNQIRNEDPASLSMLIWSTVHGFTSLEVDGEVNIPTACHEPPHERPLFDTQMDLFFCCLSP